MGLPVGLDISKRLLTLRKLIKMSELSNFFKAPRTRGDAATVIAPQLLLH